MGLCRSTCRKRELFVEPTEREKKKRSRQRKPQCRAPCRSATHRYRSPGKKNTREASHVRKKKGSCNESSKESTFTSYAWRPPWPHLRVELAIHNEKRRRSHACMKRRDEERRQRVKKRAQCRSACRSRHFGTEVLELKRKKAQEQQRPCRISCRGSYLDIDPKLGSQNARRLLGFCGDIFGISLLFPYPYK